MLRTIRTDATFPTEHSQFWRPLATTTPHHKHLQPATESFHAGDSTLRLTKYQAQSRKDVWGVELSSTHILNLGSR
jgi:hypothetical protein